MRKIYVVSVDWAFNGAKVKEILTCFEEYADAVNFMEKYWELEKKMDYFEEFDKFINAENHREGYVNYQWDEKHSIVHVDLQYVFSKEDVLSGKADALL